MNNYKNYIVTLMLSICLFALAACGTDGTAEEEIADGTSASSNSQVEQQVSEESIEVIDASGQQITFDEVPTSIATLSSGDLDILLSLNAEVVGRPTSQGEVAENLKDIQEIGNPHQPNFEKIAEVNPDVLIASPSFKQHAANLEAQGTKVIYTEANSVEDILETIDMFGEMLGKSAEAEELIAGLNEELEALSDSASAVKTLLVYGAPGSYLVALPNSLSGDLLERAGGENIASDFPQEEKYPQYASLSTEKIIERNPEAVMLITHGDPDAVKTAFQGEMEKNPAWKNLDAVKNGKVTVLPSHLFGTNPGTKVAEALEVMSDSLKEATSK